MKLTLTKTAKGISWEVPDENLGIKFVSFKNPKALRRYMKEHGLVKGCGKSLYRPRYND